MDSPPPMIPGTTTYLLEKAQADALVAWAEERLGRTPTVAEAATEAIVHLARQESDRRA